MSYFLLGVTIIISGFVSEILMTLLNRYAMSEDFVDGADDSAFKKFLRKYVLDSEV